MAQEFIINDPSMTLYAWQLMLADLIEKHGQNAILFTDSGANNCSLIIKHPPALGFTGINEIIGMTAEDAVIFNKKRRSNADK